MALKRITDAERFSRRIDTGGPIQPHCSELGQCHMFMGGKHEDGYGLFKIGSRTDGSRRTIGAHRFAWVLSFGPIPKGLLVCHRCDNPGCVRVSHLFLGTVKDNSYDMLSKRRLPLGDKSWSAMHPERLARGDKSGSRLHPGLFQGSKNGRSKLTEESVREIRARLAVGESCASLGRCFGVTDVVVCAIKHRKLWRHVA